MWGAEYWGKQYFGGTYWGPAVAVSGTFIYPDTGQIVITGYAPTLAQTANLELTPATGQIVVTGYAPSVDQANPSINLTPGTGQIIITGYAPTVVNSGVTDNIGGGGIPWNPYRRTGETEEQKYARRVAQGIIAKAKEPNADIAALLEQAKPVSLFLAADIERLDRLAAEYQALVDVRRTRVRLAGLAAVKNDALATKQLAKEVDAIKALSDQLAVQAEELDIVFVMMILAAL